MTPMDASEQPSEWTWIPVNRASIALSLSPSTIRRRIRDGAAIAVPGHGEMVLQGEREDRPQGTRFLVRLPQTILAEADEDASERPEPGVSDVPTPPTTGVDVEDLVARLGPALLQPWQALVDRLGAERTELADRLIDKTGEAAGYRHLVDSATRLASEAVACRDSWREQTLQAAAEKDALQLERDEWMREAKGWQTVAEESQAEYAAVLRAQAELRGASPAHVDQEGWWCLALRYLGAMRPW